MEFQNIFEAEDGITALQIINEHNPEIVLADIRMPGMDGIALLESTRLSHKDTKFIFISGYDSFDYAQRAIRYGAFSYLLKPIKYYELSEVINNALREINNKAILDDNISRLESKIHKNLEFIKTHLIQDIIENDSKTQRNLDEKLKDLEITFSGKYFLIIYISLDNYNILTNSLSSRDKDMLKEGLQKIALEIIDSYGIKNYSFKSDDGIVCLFNTDESTIINNRTDMNKLFHAIQNTVINQSNYTISIGVGNFVENLQFINVSYRQAQKAIMQRFIKGKNQILYFDNDFRKKDTPKSISFKNEQDLYICFEECNLQLIIEIIDSLYEPYKDLSGTDINGLSKINFQLIMSIYKILTQMNINPENILGDEFTLYNEVNQCNSISEIVNWFTFKTKTCIDHIISANDKDAHKLIEKCKEYIHNNYAKDISLESAAKYVHLSPSYLSKLFKSQTGDAFSNYVLNFRINIAKNLLSAGIYKASEVAEIAGFYDLKYFYKVFKKITGITPSAFRNL